MIELADGRPVGMLSLVNVDRHNLHAESARFLIGDEAAVKGVPAAVEAMKLLYELAFDELGLVRVCGIVAAENTLMVKWQRFLGMRRGGPAARPPLPGRPVPGRRLPRPAGRRLPDDDAAPHERPHRRRPRALTPDAPRFPRKGPDTTMLTRGSVEQIILDALTTSTRSAREERFAVGPDTELFGPDARRTPSRWCRSSSTSSRASTTLPACRSR